MYILTLKGRLNEILKQLPTVVFQLLMTCVDHFLISCLVYELLEIVKHVDQCFLKPEMSSSNILFCPKTGRYSVYSHRRGKKQENIHI